jgi:hypothetical protein
MRADVKIGSMFPDYELPDHTGEPHRLSEIQHDDPMVIVLAREAYSAKDQVHHEGGASGSASTHRSWAGRRGPA